MTEILDVKGLSCPLPILRTKKKLKDVPMGEILQVEATDPGSVKDMQAFCHQTGHEMVDWKDEDGVFTYWIRRTN